MVYRGTIKGVGWEPESHLERVRLLTSIRAYGGENFLSKKIDQVSKTPGSQQCINNTANLALLKQEAPKQDVKALINAYRKEGCDCSVKRGDKPGFS
jgi:hypothetical protein